MPDAQQTTPLWEILSVNPVDFYDVDIDALPHTQKILDKLRSNGIKTAGDLLRQTPQFLYEKCGVRTPHMNLIMNQIKKQAAYTGNSALPHEVSPTVKAIVIENRDRILAQDFSFIDHLNLRQKYLGELRTFADTTNTLGMEIITEYLRNPGETKRIIYSIQSFCEKTHQHGLLKAKLAAISPKRKSLPVWELIDEYTSDPIVRKYLYEIYPRQNQHVGSPSLPRELTPQDFQDYIDFLDWCSFSVKHEIEEYFDTLFMDEKLEDIINMRCRGCLYKAIEKKHDMKPHILKSIVRTVKDNFDKQLLVWNFYIQVYIDTHGKKEISAAELSRMCGRYGKIVIYLMLQSGEGLRRYSKEKDSFRIRW